MVLQILGKKSARAPSSKVVNGSADAKVTLGRDCSTPELCVVIVNTVVMPSATLAGDASAEIQKDTQERVTMRKLGTYVWIK